MTSEPVPDSGAVDDDDLFDQAWDRPRRTNRLTVGLVAGLIVVAGFAGGVAIQKHNDAGLVTATATTGGGAARNRAGGGAGFGAGTGTGGFAGGTGAGAGQAGAGAAGGAGAGELPVVVGTVKAISGTTLTVENFAGTAVTVRVPATATVTVSGLSGLTVGAPVSVVGTKAADGSVTATSVTSRKAPG